MNLRKVMGGIQIVIGVIWVGVSITGMVYGVRFLNKAQTTLDETAHIGTNALITTRYSLNTAREVLVDVTNTLDLVEITTIGASVAVSQTSPLLNNVAIIIAEQTNGMLFAVQGGMNNAIETAKIIDGILATVDWMTVGAVLDYDKNAPLSKALQEVDDGLNTLPTKFTEVGRQLYVMSDTFITIGEDVSEIAKGIQSANEELLQISPLLDAYTNLIDDSIDLVQVTQKSLSELLQLGKVGFIVCLVMLLLTQIPSMYVGWLIIDSNTTPSQRQYEIDKPHPPIRRKPQPLSKA